MLCTVIKTLTCEIKNIPMYSVVSAQKYYWIAQGFVTIHTN